MLLGLLQFPYGKSFVAIDMIRILANYFTQAFFGIKVLAGCKTEIEIVPDQVISINGFVNHRNVI